MRGGGISLGGILVILGIVLIFVWSFWWGLIIGLVGLLFFGGFAKGKWYSPDRGNNICRGFVVLSFGHALTSIRSFKEVVLMGAGRRRGKFLGGVFGAGIAATVASAFAIFAGVGSAASAVKPVNATPPTITGTPQEGKTLTANRGTWDNTPTDYNYFWRRCGAGGGSCANISGANALTYTLKTVDVGNTLRFRVVAKNADGQTTADSAPTEVIQKAAAPPTTTTTTTTTPPPPPPPAVNHRPTIAILSVRFAGARVYVRFRVCDDSRRNVNIIERDSKSGVPSYTRRFRTLVPPRPCAAVTRSWIPAPRFRHGRYTLTLTARDALGLTSLRPARRTFFR